MHDVSTCSADPFNFSVAIKSYTIHRFGDGWFYQLRLRVHQLMSSYSILVGKKLLAIVLKHIIMGYFYNLLSCN